jgi:hypothetical protein
MLSRAGSRRGHQVAVDGRYAVHLRGDLHRSVRKAVVVSVRIPAAQDLARLGLDLLFLAAADVGDDVVEDRVRRHARIAAPLMACMV